MQQIVNVLMSPAIGAKGSDVGGQAVSAQGEDFGIILEKTNRSLEDGTPATDARLAEGDETVTSLTDTAVTNTPLKSNDSKDSEQPERLAAPEDVVSVLAQIGFARQFAAGGESLPSDDTSPVVTAVDEDATPDGDMLVLFETLLSGADQEQRSDIAGALGVDVEQLGTLDSTSLTKLIAGAPSLEARLQQLATVTDGSLPLGAVPQGAMAQSGQPLPPSADVADELASAVLTVEGAKAGATTRVEAPAISSLAGGEPGTDKPLTQAESGDGKALPQAVAKAGVLATDKGQPAMAGSAQGVSTSTDDAQTDFSNNEVIKGAAPSERTEVTTQTANNVRNALADGSGPLPADARQTPATDSANGQGFDARLMSLQQSQPSDPVQHLSLRQGLERPLAQADMVARFAPVMHNQLLAMVRDGIQQAEVRLDPPELGAMLVRIQVQGNDTQVQFQVTAAQTKEMVEQAMPRLREMLAQQGMQLTDGQVSQDRRDNGRGDSAGHSAETMHGMALDEISTDERQFSVNQTTSFETGIDYYA